MFKFSTGKRVNNSSVFSKPLLKLLLKYYYKGFFTPFFIIIYPIIILFIQGFAYKSIKGPDGELMIYSLVPGIAIVQLMTVGIFTVPITIIEFKKSVVLKRIGATNIGPSAFVGSVIFIGVIVSIFALFWTLLWAGIMFGSITEQGWGLAFSANLGKAFPFALLTLLLSISLGMCLGSILKTETGVVALSEIIFLPAAFLGGAFIPYNVVIGSDVLRTISYFMPFRYSAWPFLDMWKNGSLPVDYMLWINIFSSIGFISLFTIISTLKLRWND